MKTDKIIFYISVTLQMCKSFIMKFLSLFLHNNKNVWQSFTVKFLSLFYFYICYDVKLNYVTWKPKVITEPLSYEFEKLCFPSMELQ